MRIHFNGVVHPTTLAKSLKRALAVHGHEVGIRTCEQHVAGITGYVNWHELQKASKRQANASPDDGLARPEVAYARQQQYLGFLASIYGPETAEELVDAIRPTGPAERDMVEQTPDDPEVPSTDGLYPFAFAHRVATANGEILVRAEGRVGIASAKTTVPVFAGEFLVPRESTATRPGLTHVVIHSIGDRLYSRLEQVHGYCLPPGTCLARDLLDVLLWRKEPSYGVAGNPMHQALALSRHRAPFHLIDHVSPPGWPIEYPNGIRTPNYVQSALYGGLAASRLGSGSEVMAEHQRLHAAGAPTLTDERSLTRKESRIVRAEGDTVAKRIAQAVGSALALVGDEVMIRTPEPCWKLTMGKAGDLSLDLYLSEYLRSRDSYEPTLFFALDEEEARDRAVQAILDFTKRPGLRTRGTLDSYDPSACRIDGNASSMAHLAAGLRESLSQAAKVLPNEAALTAAAVRTKLPVDPYPNLAQFVQRSGTDAIFGEGIIEGWNRLIRLSKGAIKVDSEEPSLARLASYGVMLRYLASTHDYEAPNTNSPEVPDAAMQG